MKPIIIVGAGVTGCVIARELARRGYRVILVEKNAEVGGLARTFRYGDLSFDIGPHRFFTQKQDISDFILGVLSGDCMHIYRDSVVHFLSRQYAWPLRPAAVFDLPCTVALRSGWDLIRLAIKNRGQAADSFEDYILRNYGPCLYNMFFKDYTQKFLGLSPQLIHAAWAQEGMKRTIIDESIASRNLCDIVKSFFVFRSRPAEFIYPRRGIGFFCDRLAQDIVSHGGEILSNTAITEISSNGHMAIDTVTIDKDRIAPEMVIWTAPITTICDLLKKPSAGLGYLSLILFNIELHEPLRRRFQWCYYGDKDIIFNRVTMPASFSSAMAPPQTGTLCVEVSAREGDAVWQNPSMITERIKRDLVKVGLAVCPDDFGRIFIEKIRDAYPIYTLRYPRSLETVKKNVSVYQNLMLAGRTGLFWYNNMDDCIENALETAQCIVYRLNPRDHAGPVRPLTSLPRP